MGLGRRIASLRRLFGVSVEELVEKANEGVPDGMGLKRTTIRNIEAESGRKKDLSLTQLCMVARGLGIPLSVLLVDYARPYAPSEVEPFASLGWTNMQVDELIRGRDRLDVDAEAEEKRYAAYARAEAEALRELGTIMRQVRQLRREYEYWSAWCEEHRKGVQCQHPSVDEWAERLKHPYKLDSEQIELLGRMVELSYAERVSLLRRRMHDAISVADAYGRLMGGDENGVLPDEIRDEARKAFQWAGDLGLSESRRSMSADVDAMIESWGAEDAEQALYRICDDMAKRRRASYPRSMGISVEALLDYFQARCLCGEMAGTDVGVSAGLAEKLNQEFGCLFREIRGLSPFSSGFLVRTSPPRKANQGRRSFPGEMGCPGTGSSF